jgi:hypothetical protein
MDKRISLYSNSTTRIIVVGFMLFAIAMLLWLYWDENSALIGPNEMLYLVYALAVFSLVGLRLLLRASLGRSGPMWFFYLSLPLITILYFHREIQPDGLTADQYSAFWVKIALVGISGFVLQMIGYVRIIQLDPSNSKLLRLLGIVNCVVLIYNMLLVTLNYHELTEVYQPIPYLLSLIVPPGVLCLLLIIPEARYRKRNLPESTIDALEEY